MFIHLLFSNIGISVRMLTCDIRGSVEHATLWL